MEIRNLCLLAAACFLASWFLPVGAEVPGWMAFRYAMSPLWPYGDTSPADVEDAIPQVASALTNVVFPIMFVMAMRGTVRRPSLFFRVAIICFVANLYWFVQLWRDGSLRDLLIGYYVWVLGFALMMIIGWRLMRPRSTPL
jgi:hypothetical protein